MNLLETIQPYVIPTVAFLIGLAVKHAYDLWRTKISRLRYSIHKSFLGASEDDQLFGSVQVLYNSHPVHNLYMVKIMMRNSSNQDFERLEMLLWCDTGSLILMSHALKQGSVEPIPFSDDYQKEFEGITDQNANRVMSRRKYSIRVLNRDDVVEFSCLLTNRQRAEPNLYLECERTGLKLEPTFFLPPQFLGENQPAAALTGTLVTAACLIPIIIFIQSPTYVAIISWLAGVLCLLPGVVVFKLARIFRKFIR
jgi:hypothetical protein